MASNPFGPAWRWPPRSARSACPVAASATAMARWGAWAPRSPWESHRRRRRRGSRKGPSFPGGGIGYGYGSLGGVGAPIAMAKSPALPALRKPNAPFIPVARIADLLLHPGDSFTYEGKVLRYPDTRLVYWAGGNPFHHHQDLNRLRRAWARPETIIVQEPMWTATARRAD